MNDKDFKKQLQQVISQTKYRVVLDEIENKGILFISKQQYANVEDSVKQTHWKIEDYTSKNGCFPKVVYFEDSEDLINFKENQEIGTDRHLILIALK